MAGAGARALRNGVVIPAHPLALDADRKLDARRQRALTRYYLDAGAGGLAVGVHTTQFAIREAGLYRAGARARACAAQPNGRAAPVVMIAGLVGRTAQASQEAQLARDARLSRRPAVARRHEGRDEDELIAHCAAVRAEIPLVGFYLQPAVGGIVLPVSFWRRFAAIENVVAIKIAPFNRYRTLDVVRGVVEAGAADRVTLYTGNDDHIVLDLVHAVHGAARNGRGRTVRINGGLLGHWSVWVASAVELLAAHPCRDAADAIDRRPAGARCAGHRLQRGVLRRRQRFSRRASPAATKSCGGRACWKASGASIPRRCFGPGRRKRSTASTPATRISTTMPSCARTWSAGCHERARRQTQDAGRLAQCCSATCVVSHWLVAWYLFVELGNVPKFVMPSPVDTLHALLRAELPLVENIAVTEHRDLRRLPARASSSASALALLFSWSQRSRCSSCRCSSAST